MKTHPLTIVVLTASLALSSCANKGVPFKPGTARKVSISSVEVPEKMFFETRGSRWFGGLGAAAGIAGALVTASISAMAIQKKQEQLRTHYQEDVRRIVSEELAARRQFEVVPAGKADADLKIKAGWGFMLKGMGGPFSGQTIPVTPLAVEMKDNQGRLLWKDYAPKSTKFISETQARKGSELKASPELMRDVLAENVRRAARELANALPSPATAAPATTKAP